MGICNKLLSLAHPSSEKGFYPVSGINASTIRPFSIIFRYVWYRETSFAAIQVLYMAHMLRIFYRYLITPLRSDQFVTRVNNI